MLLVAASATRKRVRPRVQRIIAVCSSLVVTGLAVTLFSEALTGG